MMKLWVHQKSFCEEELILNPKEFPGIQVGDILEIYHPDENNSHLLLQVKTLKNVELPQKDIISVDQTIANLFQLRAYKDVAVSFVSSLQDVGLDLVELVFKDQYISRSDMWRLKNSLVRSCIHLQQKIEFMGIRAQVSELWARGEKVMCGAVTEDTRVAFRSSTAMVYMFVQMSSEMWDFDTCGDLYIEKAVNGFLTELFGQWKRCNINSELTLVLFSRTIYEAKSINEFPESMQGALHMDSMGRIYEDFYRVVVHNERRDDWMQMLSALKQIMWEYNEAIASSHQGDGLIPKGYNSKAADGNLLEAMNMSLNVFDNHYINRNFDRTGQVVEIVTPGAGVFNVDRRLCDITKYRMIDYGIGSDLVCLAEQPPHPVPLLLFSDDIARKPGSTQTHHIPYWLNYSFYLSPSQRHRNFSSSQSHFTPRIRLPTRTAWDKISSSGEALPKLLPKTACEMHSFGSCDPGSDTDEEWDESSWDDQAIFKSHNPQAKKCNNPFVPSSLTIKLTPDRRRWTHTFPHGPRGDVIQLHHKHSSQSLLESSGNSSSELSSSSSTSSLYNEVTVEETMPDDSPSRIRSLMVNLKRRIGCGWGITGEQVWTPFLQTGVDWKSLTATACFPITTDFYPDKKTLETDYLESPHTLDIIPDDGEEAFSPSGKTIQSAFEELVSQRLIQNYQLIVLPRSEIASLAHKGSSNLPLVTNPSKHEYVLSYGQTFHKISLKPDMKSVEIVRYNARQQRTSPKLGYSYQLWAIRKWSYEVAHTRVYHKPVDNKWNHRDNYICLGGEATREGFDLQESLKFWRSRFILLPSTSSLVRKLSDSNYQGPLDVFEERSASQMLTLLDGFLRFVEGLNRKRRAPSRPQSQRPSMVDQANTPRRLMSRTGATSGDSTPTTLQPNPTLSTVTIASALASIGIIGGAGAKGKDEGGGIPRSSPGSPEPEKLSLLSPASLVTAVMRSPIEGVTLMAGDAKGLPGDSFVSAEAVAWIRKTLIGSVSHDEALSVMQAILEEGFIHSVFSAAANKTFLYGYYIYCFVPQSEVTSPDARRPSGVREARPPLTFEPTSRNPWFEVSCSSPEGRNYGKVPHRPMEESSGGKDEMAVEKNEGADLPEIGGDNGMSTGPETSFKQPAYKSLFLEIDSSKLKDRVEWCHVGYHSNYNPVSAFEIELQWLTSTPSLLQELITNWARRAVTSGFHLVPTHVDPFGFNADTSDSLHSPLFIELRLPEGCLGNRVTLEEGSKASDKMRQIQQAILARFGFLNNQTSCHSPLASNIQSDHGALPIHCQYIHVTGCAFLLTTPFAHMHLPTLRAQCLPCLCKLGASHAGCSGWTTDSRSQDSGSAGAQSPVSQIRSGSKLGFLYVHNYLLSKKWRSSATGDEKFHEALLADFSRFCQGEDGRLEQLLQTMESFQEETPGIP
ncbi:GATOR complex protein DEPDC5-like isoform X2 [Acanthaster planci]|uniref:GATOR complex protein DEPDC5-like isoform X2 n=1 Tax=Acanthaster planci TaxID=133434 RepID=A0A8B7ZUG2_ACAPL|nr:GATOR complex protein DEPDC5-like isoform X2 [Acanthaster planci]